MRVHFPIKETRGGQHPPWRVILISAAPHRVRSMKMTVIKRFVIPCTVLLAAQLAEAWEALHLRVSKDCEESYLLKTSGAFPRSSQTLPTHLPP